MTDSDIRNFFSVTNKKSESGKMIEKKKIDLKTDIKIIQRKIKKESKKKQNDSDSITPKKKINEIDTKINLNVYSKLKDEKIENDNILKKKKIIVDDDDEREIEINNNLAVKNNNEKINSNEKKIYQIKEKKESLIPISVSDFFSGKKNIQKEKKEEKENKISFIQNMEIEEEELNNDNKNININMNINININNNNNSDEKINNNNKNNINENNNNIDKNKINNININNKSPDKIPEKNIKESKKDLKNIKTINIEKTEKSKNEETSKNLYFQNKEKPISNKLINLESPLNLLWSDRYKPKTISDIIGNQSQIKNIIEWLDNWNNCIFNNIKREKVSNNKFSKPENLNARALIVSGSPGIGKTSSIRVISQFKGYKVFELNASDKRNKDIINNSVGFLMNNTTLNGDSITNKNLIIMDEIDGMNGNEDKGGIKALIDIVKKTKVPIIFICNDIYSNKLKSLLNYCYDIRFNKPDKRLIVNRLYNICKKENINIEHLTLDYIVESFNNDIRQCLNYLDLISRGENKNNINNEKDNCNNFKKDQTVSNSSFDVVKKLLTKSELIKLNFTQKLDLFFIDFDLIPHLIYENFPNTIPKENNKLINIEKLCEITENISYSDLIEKRIKGNNEWNLLPNKGIHSVIIPSYYSSSFCSYPKFPEFYSKISKMRKTKRQIKDIKTLFPFYNINSIKNEISPLLFKIIINLLNENGKESIDEIINIFNIYKISLMQFKDSLFDLQSENTQKIYNKINPSLKSYFTRKLNDHFKTSIKVTKSHNENNSNNNIKRDYEGNIIEDENDDIEELSDDDNSSIFEPVKSRNKKYKNSKK